MRIILLVALLFSTLVSISQNKPASFGIQFRPTLPSSLYNSGLYETQDSLNYTTQSIFGYSFGMLIHKEISKTLNIESGLVFTERNYHLTVDDEFDVNLMDTKYQIVGYEVPINLLAYIRAADNQYVTVALGVVANLFPSSVAGSDQDMKHETERRNWIQGAVNGNVGWELRLDGGDAVYVGASVHLPWQSIYFSRIGRWNALRADAVQEIGGDYLSLDFRYFFASKKSDD